MTTSSDTESHGDSGGSFEGLLNTVHQLARKWAEDIDHMRPVDAQQFIGRNTHALLSKLSDGCGADFAVLLVESIERNVWELYDQKHRQISAT